MDAKNALMTTWVGGSVTPFAGLNSGVCFFLWLFLGGRGGIDFVGERRLMDDCF